MGIYLFEHAQERNKTICNFSRLARVMDGYLRDSHCSYDVARDRLDCDQLRAIAFRDEGL